MNWYGLNRTLCGVFEDMRTFVKVLENAMFTKEQNWNMLKSLIEEGQILGNRLEAALYDTNDLETLHKEISEKKKELKKLNEEIKEKKG